MGKRIVRKSNTNSEMQMNTSVGWVLISLLIMYVLTGVLLLITAALIYNFKLSVAVSKMIILAIYVLTGLTGGFLIGKRMQSKRYIWGLVVGGAYFFILILVSLIMNGGRIEDGVRILITGVLCVASAMIGGMIS